MPLARQRARPILTYIVKIGARDMRLRCNVREIYVQVIDELAIIPESTNKETFCLWYFLDVADGLQPQQKFLPGQNLGDVMPSEGTFWRHEIAAFGPSNVQEMVKAFDLPGNF